MRPRGDISLHPGLDRLFGPILCTRAQSTCLRSYIKQDAKKTFFFKSVLFLFCKNVKNMESWKSRYNQFPNRNRAISLPNTGFDSECWPYNIDNPRGHVFLD